jgi:hypothetical protein
VQGTAVWAASPEGARYDFRLPVPCRLARPFRVGTGKWVCFLTQADGRAGLDRPFGAQLQISRLTSLLIRMKRHERQMEALENNAVCHDVIENKSG